MTVVSLLAECCVFKMTRQDKNSAASLSYWRSAILRCHESLAGSSPDARDGRRHLPLRTDAPQSWHFLTSLHFRQLSGVLTLALQMKHTSLARTAVLSAWHACLAFLTSLLRYWDSCANSPWVRHSFPAFFHLVFCRLIIAHFSFTLNNHAALTCGNAENARALNVHAYLKSSVRFRLTADSTVVLQGYCGCRSSPGILGSRRSKFNIVPNDCCQ